jgi:hypothetical protein
LQDSHTQPSQRLWYPPVLQTFGNKEQVGAAEIYLVVNLGFASVFRLPGRLVDILFRTAVKTLAAQSSMALIRECPRLDWGNANTKRLTKALRSTPLHENVPTMKMETFLLRTSFVQLLDVPDPAMQPMAFLTANELLRRIDKGAISFSLLSPDRPGIRTFLFSAEK